MKIELKNIKVSELVEGYEDNQEEGVRVWRQTEYPAALSA